MVIDVSLDVTYFKNRDLGLPIGMAFYYVR